MAWICPRCSAVNADWVARCNCSPSTFASDSTNIEFCTCGTTTVCPIHQKFNKPVNICISKVLYNG